MKVKKWLLGLMTFAAMVVLCAVCASAQTYGDFEYGVLDDGTVEITDYNGSAGAVDIPEKIDGRSVTSISSYAFWSCTSLTSITIPNSVTSIGGWAFEWCKNLTSITIPDSVTEIGSGAFESCTSLTVINVATGNKNFVLINGVLYNKNKTKLICYPAGKKDKSYSILDSVTEIGDSAFSGCASLTSITIPDGVTSISNGAFSGCTSLTSITIPDSVTSIGYSAFRGCASLTSITIPDSVTSIGEGAFSYCASLTSITIPDSVTSIGEGAFSYCASLASITIPNSATKIGGSAFDGCISLTSITIPDSVMSIGNYAFRGCASLTSITIPNSVTNIYYSAFSGCTSLTAINVATGNQNYVSVNGVLYNKNKTKLICYPAGKKDKSYSILDSVTEIGDSAFSGCASLTSITIPDGVTSISNGAFSGCTSLTSITIPDSVTSIGGSAFRGCTSLTSITMPDSVTSIGGSAFGGCTSLTSITIPDSLTSIGGSTFSDCTSLTSITMPNSVTEIGYRTFSGCESLKSIAIPNSVTSIGDGAFQDCTSLTSITIPDSVKIIGYSAFSGCTNLASITIPDGVTEIGYYAFKDCTNLAAINVSTGNQNYVSVNGVLYNKDKTKLICYPAGKKDKNYSILESVTSIGTWAFKDCTSLASVTIPSSVTEIGSYAFENCTSLTSVKIPNSVTKIDNYAFGGCTSLKSITIPDSVTYISDKALGYYYDNGYKKIDNFKIYCYGGTAGEEYAKENGFDYVLLDKLPTLAKVTGFKLGGRAADALRVNWSKNANADGYIVEMYQGGKWVRVAKITNNSTTTFRKAGLKAGTVYKFRVKAYKMYDITAAYSEYSATVTARTNPSVIKGAKLGGRAADALRINWSKNASADGYIVEMYQGNKWVRVGKITSNSTTTFRKAGLKASSVYKFRVRAYKMSGSTALYGNYSATFTARTNPSIMKGVKIGGKAKDALRVNWTKNTSAQGYIVEMYKGGKWVRVAKITNGNTTTFRKAGLAKNTTYKFRVKAYYMSGKTALYGNYGSVSGKTAVK